MLGALCLSIASCSEPDDEITSYTLKRNLSPTDFGAKSVTQSTAELNWTLSAHATSYTVEVFADDSLTFVGTPVQTIPDIKESPYTLTGLDFDTPYSVRIKAITANDDSRTSTWNEAYFRTSAKQFMKTPKPEDIADRSVTISWNNDEGIVVSTIIIGTITHDVTDEENAACKALVDGLTPETEYTAIMYSNGKQCGKRTFTTIADLNGAILIHEGDDVKQAIEDAEDGAVIAFYGGSYFLSPSNTKDEETGEILSTAGGALKVTKNLTLKGIYPTDRPILKGRFEMYAGAGMNISQVIIDGSENASGDQTFNYKDATDYKALVLNNVEIKNFVKGICYGNVVGTIDSITFDACIIHDIECDGGDFFDIRKNYVKKVEFLNSTIYNCAHKRDFIRYDDGSSSYSEVAPEIIVDHCTINNVLNDSKEKRLLYVRMANNSITWKNNIVANTKAVYANQSKTNTPTYENNYYFNCESANLFAASNPEADPKTYWNGDVNGKNGADPKFTLNAETGIYTIGNEDVKKLEVGDPRGYK